VQQAGDAAIDTELERTSRSYPAAAAAPPAPELLVVAQDTAAGETIAIEAALIASVEDATVVAVAAPGVNGGPPATDGRKLKCQTCGGAFHSRCVVCISCIPF
jgi:hypothetical protein